MILYLWYIPELYTFNDLHSQIL